MLTHLSKPSQKLLDCCRKIHNDVHIDTYYQIIANQNSYHDDKSTKQCFTCVFCHQLIRNVRSRRRIDSYSIIAHPVNFDICSQGRSLKCDDKNSTYIYIYIDMTLSIIDKDFPYQFNLRLIAPLFTVSFQCLKKKVFFLKVGRSVNGCRSG